MIEVADTRAERARLHQSLSIAVEAWARDWRMKCAFRATYRSEMDALACLDERRAIAGTLDQLVTVPAWKLAVRVKTARADAIYLAKRDAKANATRLRRWEIAAIAQNGVCMEMWAELWPTGHHEITCEEPATYETSDGYRICDRHVKEYQCESTIELPEIAF